MGLARDLSEACLQVGQLEAREANWVAHDAQWVNILTNPLHAIVGLLEQREKQREEMEQQREEVEQLKDEGLFTSKHRWTWMGSLRPWTKTWRRPTS
jgi:predicted transcriptional regulator YheO